MFSSGSQAKSFASTKCKAQGMWDAFDGIYISMMLEMIFT